MKWLKDPLTGLYLQGITHVLFTIGLPFAFYIWLAFTTMTSAMDENPDTLLQRFMVRGFPFSMYGYGVS